MPQPDNDSPTSSATAISVVVTRQARSDDTIPDPSLESDTITSLGRARYDDEEHYAAPGAPVWESLDNIIFPQLGLDEGSSGTDTTQFDAGLSPAHMLQEMSPNKTKVSFHKWVKKLHQRHVRHQKKLADDERSRWQDHSLADALSVSARSSRHGRSSSDSSFAFVTTAQSASVSLASASIFGRSRKDTARSTRGHSRTDRSSRASFSGARHSEDSQFHERPLVMDPAVSERALQRRRIVEELISTEEGYIGDIRFLVNVYVTILASLPTLHAGLRSSINRNLTDIIELHEELLGDLHKVVPDSEYSQIEPTAPLPSASRPHHIRWRSLDAVPEEKPGMSWLQQVPGMTTEPQVAAEVAKVFAKKTNRFFVYEEYGAKYELMIRDLAVVHRTMPEWDKYQKGLETLASSLGSVNNYDDQARKALTVGDLLVKPIQRMCKYPLLFAELLKHTPVCDCPHSYLEIESALIRLREATGAINRATDDAKVKAILEKTWLLQDRLVFPNQRLDAVSKARIRAFGHIQLCGVLYVCWQTRDGVKGAYMVCLLYREWLCLATVSKTEQIYTIRACIALTNLSVEEADNGRGLQCHTALFSWKLVFECDHQLYEIIMTACTPKEEMEWCSRLESLSTKNSEVQPDPPHFSSLSLNIKTLGAVFRKPGTVARRISIHRATTVGPKSPLCQVILKNTSVEKEVSGSASKSSINRSQSLLTTNSRIPTLAPSRGERARLEAFLSDVWTRDILPFPGITVRARSEHLVRSSASSMMRKLSVTSIASTFTKRSSSFTSINKTSSSDEPAINSSSSDAPRGLYRANRESIAKDLYYDCEEASRSRLSVISDEVGKQNIPPPPSPAETETDVMGTVRRLEQLRLESEFKPRPRGPSVLRASSLDSLRSLTRRASKSVKTSSSPKPSEKSIQISQETCKASSIKSTSRWSRPGFLHRGVTVQSLRSFFR